MPVRSTIALIKEAFTFARENDLKTIAAAIHSKEAHPFVQFAKYGFCGGLATVIGLGTFYLLALTVFPNALDRSVSDEVRRNYAVYANLCAWPLSNVFAYLSNAVWVFTGGRHHRAKEFLYFSLVSFISFGAGLLAGPQLIKWFGISTHLAQASLVVTSVLVNYVLRKFFIFQK